MQPSHGSMSVYQLIDQLVQDLACKPEEISSRISQIQEKNKDLEKKLRSFTQKIRAGIAMT